MADASITNPGCPASKHARAQIAIKVSGVLKSLKTKLASAHHSGIFDRFRSDIRAAPFYD
jgi:hypothetical protein